MFTIPILIAELFSRNPFRTADWRWQRAAEILSADGRPQRRDDSWVRLAVRYLRDLRAITTEAQRQALCELMPDFVAAHRLYAHGGLATEEMTARLLAGEDPCRIYIFTGVPVSVIELYTAIFYDVTRAVQTSALDWLTTNALGFGPRHPSVPTEAQIWRYLALVGGPIIVDLVIADYLKRPEPKIEGRHELAEKGRFMAREFASDWSIPSAATAILEEGCRLFHDTMARQSRTDPLLATQMASLRRSAGLETEVEQSQEPKDTNGLKQAGKDVPHEAAPEASPEFPSP